MNDKRIPFHPIMSVVRSDGGWSNGRYNADAVIYTQGDASASVFYLKAGNVKVTVSSESGKDSVPAVLGPGDFFGENCLLGHPFRMATISAMTDCAVLMLSGAAMAKALQSQPHVSEVFIDHLLRRSIRSQEDLVDQMVNCSEKRLARLLLRLASFRDEDDFEPALANVSPEMLAGMVGTTRSRISFFMNKFRRLGLIGYGGDTRDLCIHASLRSVI